MNNAEFHYVTGQARPTFAALLAEFESRSAAAVDTEDCRLDLRYGPAPRQTFDFFAARARPRGTLAYFHAGYWQARDKATFRFIAPVFTRLGLNVALVNYPLCPSVTLGALTDAARASVGAIGAHAVALGPPGLPLVMSGHSAGAHLAIEMALTQATRPDAWDHAIAGVIALSGIYDLAPLLGTSLNRNLGLDADSAAANSPLRRVVPGSAPALFVVGAQETPAFLDQSRQICAAWQAVGSDATLQLAPDADHFSLLQQLVSPQSALFGQVGELLEQVLR